MNQYIQGGYSTYPRFYRAVYKCEKASEKNKKEEGRERKSRERVLRSETRGQEDRSAFSLLLYQLEDYCKVKVFDA
jgi:hypothetical protein